MALRRSYRWRPLRIAGRRHAAPLTVACADGELRFAVPPPIGFRASGFRLEPLGPEHTRRDFQAVMAARVRLRRVFAPEDSWPEDGLSEADNRADLLRHAGEHGDRLAYTWSVLAAASDRVVGCLYLDPHAGPDWDVEGYWWLAEPEFRRGREHRFRQLLRRWLDAHWPGARIAWPGRAPSWEPWLAYCARHGLSSRHAVLPPAAPRD